MSLVVLKDFRRKAVASCLLRALMANLPEGTSFPTGYSDMFEKMSEHFLNESTIGTIVLV
jgi:hypothetical protein